MTDLYNELNHISAMYRTYVCTPRAVTRHGSNYVESLVVRQHQVLEELYLLRNK